LPLASKLEQVAPVALAGLVVPVDLGGAVVAADRKERVGVDGQGVATDRVGGMAGIQALADLRTGAVVAPVAQVVAGAVKPETSGKKMASITCPLPTVP
jgi:hypothetical protein